MSSPEVKIAKIDEDEQLVFGWATVSLRNGREVVDSDGEVIEPEDLEKAVYDYVLDVGDCGELHQGDPVARVVESFMVTPQKAAAMGLTLPDMVGWWVGYKIADADVFAKVKDGTYRMFSVEGYALAEEVT